MQRTADQIRREINSQHTSTAWLEPDEIRAVADDLSERGYRAQAAQLLTEILHQPGMVRIHVSRLYPPR